MVCGLFANTYVGGADELEMKWTMSPERVNQEDRLLALDLSGDLLQDILDVKYNCKNSRVCLTTILIRMRTQKKNLSTYAVWAIRSSNCLPCEIVLSRSV
jgi:hypothetical protein